MKIAAFALLLSGVFTTTMIPTATTLAEDLYAPWQGSASNRATTFLPNQGVELNQTGSGWSTGMPSPYRFRPLAGQTQPFFRAPPHPAWGASVVANNQAWQANRGGRFANSGARQHYPQGYRFRPLSPADQQTFAPPPRVAYRPANITIPNNYVYRPLNPGKSVQPRVQTPNHPPAPQYGYAPHAPLESMPLYGYYARPMSGPLPMPRYTQPASHYSPPAPRYAQPASHYSPPTPRYVYRHEPYSGLRFRPDSRVNGNPRYANPRYDMNRMPRYAASPRPYQPMFRPSPRFGPPAPPAYAYPPGYDHPAMAYSRPWVEVPRPQSYPAFRQPIPDAFAGYENSRTDWYDGRADGDGAWYKLTELQSWPRVSQNWPEDNYGYSGSAD